MLEGGMLEQQQPPQPPKKKVYSAQFLLRFQATSTGAPDWLPTYYGGSAERHAELLALREGGSAGASPVGAPASPPPGLGELTSSPLPGLGEVTSSPPATALPPPAALPSAGLPPPSAGLPNTG